MTRGNAYYVNIREFRRPYNGCRQGWPDGARWNGPHYIRWYNAIMTPGCRVLRRGAPRRPTVRPFLSFTSLSSRPDAIRGRAITFTIPPHYPNGKSTLHTTTKPISACLPKHANLTILNKTICIANKNATFRTVLGRKNPKKILRRLRE